MKSSIYFIGKIFCKSLNTIVSVKKIEKYSINAEQYNIKGLNQNHFKIFNFFKTDCLS